MQIVGPYLCGSLPFRHPGSPELHLLKPWAADCGCLLAFQPYFLWIRGNLQVQICTSQYPVLSPFVNLLQSLLAFGCLFMLSDRLIFPQVCPGFIHIVCRRIYMIEVTFATEAKFPYLKLLILA